MARYPASRCPNCGSLAHMCQCGTMQDPRQLPARIQRQMQGMQPRGFMQTGPQPPAVAPQGYPQRYPQAPAPVPQLNLDQLFAMPEVQSRVNDIVEHALANYNPPAPQEQPPVMGIAPEALYQLAQMSSEEVPGEAPKNNAGGRLNAYKTGREEVVKYIKEVIGGLLEVVHEQQGLSVGEQAIAGGPQGHIPGPGPVQDVLRESNPAGV